MGKDYYALLGVSRDATSDNIKRGYRKMAIKWHPDKHANSTEAERAAAEEKFKDIAQAFEVLSDPEKRAVYDEYGEEGLKAPSGGAGQPDMSNMNSFPGGFGGVPGGVRVVFSHNGAGPGMDGMSNLRAEEIFRSFFGSDGSFGGIGGFGDDGFSDLLAGVHGRNRGPPVRSQSKRSRQERCDTLSKGSLVRLAGLENTKLNGARGRIVEFDEHKQRYQVVLDNSGPTIAIKPPSVQQILRCVEVVRTSRGEVNGCIAKEAYFDPDVGRYMLDGIGQNTMAFRPENVKLPASTLVTIEGMRNRKDLNGMCGRVVAADDERYTVELQTGEQVRVRVDAVTTSLVPIR